MRATPTNNKKRIRSNSNAAPEAVDLFADLTLTELSHKTSQQVPLDKTEMVIIVFYNSIMLIMLISE